jgi:hypothetical protein
MFRAQSQLHFGVLSAGQVIWHVCLIPIPQETISQELDPSANKSGGGFTPDRTAACVGVDEPEIGVIWSAAFDWRSPAQPVPVKAIPASTTNMHPIHQRRQDDIGHLLRIRRVG